MLHKNYRKFINTIKINLIYRRFHHAEVLKPGQHKITPKKLSHNAIKVIETLTRQGYQAFLVGGCIRDLLLGKTPKDFDVVTNAAPEEVRKLFSWARVVGKRFRIVHIRFKGELIEVTTFRGHDDTKHDDIKTVTHGREVHKSDKLVKSASGMTLRDNVYGSIKEDAERRDFTVNAFYYDLFSEQVFTFGSGFQDLTKKTLKIIGDPHQRYCEDPVRMLRVLRLAVKLRFTIETDTLTPILQLHGLLKEVSPGRLYEEFKKMFLQGHAELLFKQLFKYKLMHHFFPTVRHFNHAPLDEGKYKLNYKKLVLTALKNTDQRVAQRKSITPAFLCAILLWPELIKRVHEPWYELEPGELSKISILVLNAQKKFMFIPRPLMNRIHNIWLLQLNLMQQETPDKIISDPDFRIAYDFLLLREQALDETKTAFGQWWTDYLAARKNQRK